MDAVERRKYALSRLEDHRHLLRIAIAAMADGDLTRALNIATTIRLLVHETARQKPLLKELRPDYLDLPIMERVIEPPRNVPPGMRAVVFFCPLSAKLTVSPGMTSIGLITDLPSPMYTPSTLGAWWENPCMILPGLGPFFRKELILNLADKEGAHVDPNISKRYRQVLESRFVRVQLNGENSTLNVSRLVGGRCGVELLDYLERNFPAPSLQPAGVSVS